MSKNSVVTRPEVLDTPANAVNSIEALQHNYRYILMRRLTTESIIKIQDKRVELAEAGDRHARRELDAMLLPQAPAPSVTMQQNVLVSHSNTAFDAVKVTDIRRNIVLFLQSAGASNTVAIAKALHTHTGDVYEALDNPWFRLDKGKWFVTKQALLDILPSHEE